MSREELERLASKRKLPEFRPQAVEFLGEKVRDSSVGSGKEHLAATEEDQITEHVHK
jgi:hypothetical protein